MEDTPQRRVYDSGLILQRRPGITAVAVTEDGQRAFLGLDGGLLEEYAVERINESVTASLTARKPVVFKQAILSILPAIGANCLVLQTGDGALRFIHSDTFEGRVVEKGPVLAAAVFNDTITTQTPLLGFVARMKGLGRVLKLFVYTIKPAGGRVADAEYIWDVDLPSASSSVNHTVLEWVGKRIVVGINTHYYLAWGGKDANAGGVKGRLMDLLTMEEGSGHVMLATLPRQKAIMLVTGSISVAVNAVGEAIGTPISLEGMSPLQALAVGSGLVAFMTMDGLHLYEPMTGKRVQNLALELNTLETPLRAASGGSLNSKVILVASLHKVWAIVPLPASEQVRDLLMEGDLKAAEELTREGKAKGEKWADFALAEVGRGLINDGRIKEACSILELCPLDAFQPAELFDLFPDYTRRWEGQYQAPHYGRKNQAPFRSLNNILQTKRTEGLSYEGRMKESKVALIEYLLRARELPGIIHLDGIDTLLMHLFVDLGMHEQAAAFATMPNHVVLDCISTRLTQLDWHHTVATLTAASGHASEALAIWKQIITDQKNGDHIDMIQNEEWELKEARLSVLSQLSDASACPAPLALEYLPWALETFPDEVGIVLSSRRDFNPSVVLPLLQEGSTARWQYLSHLIQDEGMNDPDIHTMFAVDLIKSIFLLEPLLQRPLPVSCTQIPKGMGWDKNAKGDEADDDFAPPSLPLNGNGVLQRRKTPIGMTQPHDVSVSQLVSYGGAWSSNDDKRANDVQYLRFRLKNHLENSSLWEKNEVFPLLQDSSLYEETVVASWKTGDHELALRILAITLHDIGAAIQYAAAFLAPQQHLGLLHMLLRPDNGGVPLWEDACSVVSALGETLDPVEVLKVVPDIMPMSSVLHLVSPMLRERLHGRRSSQMTMAMQKHCAVMSSRNLVRVQSLNVAVNDQSTCCDCHLRIGGKVFVVLRPFISHLGIEDSTLLCFSCWNKRIKFVKQKENGHSLT